MNVAYNMIICWVKLQEAWLLCEDLDSGLAKGFYLMAIKQEVVIKLCRQEAIDPFV